MKNSHGSRPRWFVTGATGALAPFLIHELLHGPKPPFFVCLARRPDSAERLRERIALLCEPCARKVDEKNFEIVRGDVVQGFIYGRPVDAVWHFAADLRMENEAAEEVRANNLNGTRQILEFCESADAPLFYVSTAYVCGRRTGTVHEDELFCGQTFRNAYEFSKAEAELLVREWMARHRAVVFRPSIVLGDVETGVVLSFHGVFRLLQWLHDFKEHLLPRMGFSTEGLGALVLRPPITFAAPLSETYVNLVGAPYVASLMEKIASRRSAFGKTFHLVNPAPPSGEELLRVLARLLGVKAIEPLSAGNARNNDDSLAENGLRAVERRVSHWLGDKLPVFWPYLFGAHPMFDMSNVRALCGELPAHPRLDQSAWERMYRYSAAREFTPV